ncbi:alpha/beta hydrolase [Nocardia sp. NPDC005366]|uniref:alpha/beta hydrolase n=1 Tax=Nocardia sp. NPDC005366 TaxID=3156878 RepID=UPI0033AF1207
MLRDIGGNHEIDHADPIAQMIVDASHYYSIKLPTPDRITHAELQRLSMPVYVAMAEKSALHDPEAAVATAKTYVNDVSAKSWQGATHSLPMEFSQELDRDLLGFIADHDTKGNELEAEP